MTDQILVPKIFDNHEVIANALQPFTEYAGVCCTVSEAAESPEWIVVVQLPSGKRVTGVLDVCSLMEPVERRSALIRDWVGNVLALS